MEQGDSVLIAGGTGLVGERLTQLLIQNGYKVALLSRKKYNNGNISVYEWDVERGTIDENAILNADYIINLAGESVAGGRWTPERKKRIIESRSKSAALLLNTCQRLKTFPKVYISAAAIGYYGNRGSEILDEESSAGKGFLTESCIEWENAAQQWSDTEVRTVICRIGVVLSMNGGALKETMKGDDKAAIEEKTKALTDISGKMTERLHANQQAAGGEQGHSAETASGHDENVVEAEFEEVDKDTK